MKILVTGTSGFIGAKLAQRLTELDHTVIGVDFSDSGTHTTLVKDISDKTFVEEFEGIDVDVIYHLAAQSGGYRSLIDPHTDSVWNCSGTANMVNLGKKLKVKKFNFISSMAVYGNGQLVSEDTPPNPISFYGVSKYAGELQTKLLLEHNKIPYSIYRLFATYGSGQDLENPHQGILSIYLNQALQHNHVKITGKKDRVRELIHVDDVVSALELGLSNETNNKVFNVSNNEKLTPEIIINAIGEQLGKKLEIIELEGYVGDQTYITSKRSNLSYLGWSPSINLQEGIKEFIDSI